MAKLLKAMKRPAALWGVPMVPLLAVTGVTGLIATGDQRLLPIHRSILWEHRMGAWLRSYKLLPSFAPNTSVFVWRK